MAVVGGDNLTLTDLYRTYGTDSINYQVSELMSIATPVVANLPWVQATDTTVHKAMVRDSLPTVGYGQFNVGTSPSKTSKKLVEENMGWLEGLSETDSRLLEFASNPKQVRFDQEKAFFEAFAQKFESDFFYGSLAANPKGFKGLAPRYNTLSGDIGKYVVSAGGSGSDNASIWIVNHGDDSTQGIYPKGQQGGIKIDDWGSANVIKDSNGRSLKLAQTYFKWWVGITVGDYRNNVRIANIDVSDVKADPTGATIKLIDLISDAMDRIPVPPRGFAPVTMPGYKEQMKPMSRRTAIYMPRAIYSVLQKQLNNKTNYGLLLGQGAGTGYTNFRDVPFFLTDSLLLNEAAVA